MTVINNIAFGILSLPEGHLDLSPAARRRARDLTITWSRYGFFGPMIEGDTVEEILNEACDLGFEWCLIQQWGHVFIEKWVPAGSSEPDFCAALCDWIGRNEAPVTATRLPNGGLDPTLILVNMPDYDAMGRPEMTALASSEDDSLISDFPHSLRVRSTKLFGESAASAEAFCRMAGNGIDEYPSRVSDLSEEQRGFLDGVAAQTRNSRRGVFLFNIESYDDISKPPIEFAGPVSTLYTVAAGFKPNRILETHAFTPSTRVVYFDYSQSALSVRREMLEKWNGVDFPSFLKFLFRKFPHPETFYQLWDDATPATVDWSDIEQQWQRELNRWGGPESFADSWGRYRTIEHQFVNCSVLDSFYPLLQAMRSEPEAVIWWSNAFFTVYSNWFHTIGERRASYEKWIRALADANPDIWLYGSDFNNVSVNSVQAGRYLDDYFESRPDALRPRNLGKVEMRM